MSWGNGYYEYAEEKRGLRVFFRISMQLSLGTLMLGCV